MGMSHGTPIVQSVGMGLQAMSQLSSAATSLLRSRSYIQACNEDLFHPSGLHVAILPTRDMLVAIGHPDQRLKILPLETIGDAEGTGASMAAQRTAETAAPPVTRPQDEPLVRKMGALKGYSAPLDFDVPSSAPPGNFLDKMSAWQARKVASKQQKKDAERREKREEKKMKFQAKEATGERKVERKLAELERLRGEEGGRRKERDIRRAQEKYEREERKQAKKAGRGEKGEEVDRKEENDANKIRWVVVSKWEGRED